MKIKGYVVFATHSELISYDGLISKGFQDLGYKTIALTSRLEDENRALEIGFNKVYNIDFKSVSKYPSSSLELFDFLTFKDSSFNFNLKIDRKLRFRSSGYAKKYASCLISFYNYLFQNYNIKLAIGEVNYLAYNLLRKKALMHGINHLMYINVPHIEDRIIFDNSLDLSCLSKRQNNDGELTSGESMSILNVKRPKYFNDFIDKSVSNKHILSIPRFKNYSGLFFSSHSRPFVPTIFEMILDKIQNSVDVLKRFIIVPILLSSSRSSKPKISLFLNHNPEYVINVVGRFLRDEYLLIKLILENLPESHVLAVKDHVTMSGKRSFLFYFNILLLIVKKKVVFVDSNADSHGVIKESACVLTVSGTVATEAMLFDVPALILSRYFRSKCLGITRVSELQYLNEYIYTALHSFEKVDDQDKLKAFSYWKSISYASILPESIENSPELISATRMIPVHLEKEYIN
jgi:hypothetical protein